ncbi:MAG: hypothetical protein KDB90_05585 [Planctomycetes bacterium]|nr:hypothetical protein [Planctomycetota bacterium]
MPHFEESYKKYREKGVHYFALEGDGLTMPENQAFAGEWGYSFPIVTLADSKLSGYDVVTMPSTFVINAFGRVVFQGDGDYEKYIEASLKDAPYPYLAKNKVASECEKAAEAFAKGDYTTARTLANELLAGEPAEEVAADASHIVGRCEAFAKLWRDEADAAKADGRYEDALSAVENLATHFKGEELGDKAGDEAKELKKDKDAKAEIKARKDLAKVLAANKKLKTKEDKLSALYKFYEKNEGTAAASDAKAMAEAIKDSKLFK